MIKLENIDVTFTQGKKVVNAVRNVSVNVEDGDIYGIIGYSGAGKSTLVRTINLLQRPTSGNVEVNGVDLLKLKPNELRDARKRIGMIFQHFNLMNTLSVFDNVAFPLKKAKKPLVEEGETAVDPNAEPKLVKLTKKEIKEKVDSLLQLVGLEDKANSYPSQLSGGQKQRVAIGRALLTDPDILLMDEPLSALDVPRKRELMQYLESLSKEINVPILYVTHSLDELLRLADRVVLMENGKVKAYDTLENVWNSPLFAPWKGESEQSSVLALPVYLHNPTYKMTALSLGEQQLWINEVYHQANEKVRVCIYSSDVSLTLSKPEQTSIRNILRGQIVQIVPQENRIDIAVLVEGHKVWASISKWAFNELHFAQGMDVYVQIKAISVV